MTADAYPDLVRRLRAGGCVFAEDEARLLLRANVSDVERDRLVARRVAGEPLEYLLGWVEFCGIRIGIVPGVFIPRRRTEFLVEQAVRVTTAGATVVDLCCGSGAIGLALARRVPGIMLHASDSDPDAAACARTNLAPVAGRVYEGDLFAALPDTVRGTVRTLTANVPYVPTAAIPLLPHEAQDHERRRALDGGTDGLQVLRRVAAEAPGWLSPGGHLLMEIHERQATGALDALTASGLSAHAVQSDESAATVVVAQRPI